ncbi:MAG: RsmB/NOP family class I SAM-dependent RNA methyltransferase [Candidatus Thorarchaeota archaeon]|nr:MAG: RsmB/NOP family class I SAM-dependent RNA methyltransferase [Candidatus Thorarchaeota archaeon]
MDRIDGLSKKIWLEALRVLSEHRATRISMRAHLRKWTATMGYDKRTRSLVETLVMGTTRYRNTIDFIIARVSHVTGKARFNTWEHGVLRLVLFTCRWLGQDFNKILGFLEGDYLHVQKLAKLAVTFDLERAASRLDEISMYSILLSHPSFIVETLFENLSKEDAISLMKANNESRIVYLRPNMLSPDRLAVEDLAKETSLEISKDSDITGLYRIEGSAERIVTSEAYTKGLVILQDKTSVIAVKALSPLHGATVWDACAAPGMKTQLIEESMDETSRVVASDVHVDRLRTALDQAKLYGMRGVSWLLSDSITCPVVGASRILIDAPCSSTGMLRSHPSLKWRLNKEMLLSLMTIQNRILDGVISGYAERPGTEIVYATCSILPHEGESQIDSTMDRHNVELLDASPYGRPGYSGFKCSSKVRRFFPHTDGTNGFFLARLRITG